MDRNSNEVVTSGVGFGLFDELKNKQKVMAKKKSFVLRIDPDVYDAIEKWAAQEFRSANGQIEWIIDKALRDAKRTVEKSTKNETEEESD